MNSSEGIRRLTQSIRWIGVAALVLGIGVALTAYDLPRRWEYALVPAIGSATFCAACWLLAWIIDGFAAPKQ